MLIACEIFPSMFALDITETHLFINSFVILRANITQELSGEKRRLVESIPLSVRRRTLIDVVKDQSVNVTQMQPGIQIQTPAIRGVIFSLFCTSLSRKTIAMHTKTIENNCKNVLAF